MSLMRTACTGLSRVLLVAQLVACQDATAPHPPPRVPKPKVQPAQVKPIDAVPAPTAQGHPD